MVQDERLDSFISELITRRSGQDEWATTFFDYDFSQLNAPQIPGDAHACLLDMLPANELNPNTALRYFRWADANLDDVEKLFVNYAE